MSYATYMQAEYPVQIQERISQPHANAFQYDYGQTMRYAENEQTEKKFASQSVREKEDTSYTFSTPGLDFYKNPTNDFYKNPTQEFIKNSNEWETWMQAPGMMLTQQRITDIDSEYEYTRSTDRTRVDEYAIPANENYLFSGGRIDPEAQHTPYSD